MSLGTHEIPANFVGTRALPDDGVGEGFARMLIPDNSGFPLIGNTDGRQVRAGDPGFKQRSLDHIPGVLPDFSRAMLHPAGPGENLFVFFLIQPHDVAAVVENDEAVAGCALI